MNYKFWMVYSPNGNPPKFKHDDSDAAEAEANRLAAANPGETFVVLEAMNEFKTAAPQVERVRLEEAPQVSPPQE
jgi:hypothetical protein